MLQVISSSESSSPMTLNVNCVVEIMIHSYSTLNVIMQNCCQKTKAKVINVGSK